MELYGDVSLRMVAVGHASADVDGWFVAGGGCCIGNRGTAVADAAHHSSSSKQLVFTQHCGANTIQSTCSFRLIVQPHHCHLDHLAHCYTTQTTNLTYKAI